MQKRSSKPQAEAAPEKQPKARAPLREYPKFSLEDALEIPGAIHDKYSGKPMPPQSLAEACGSTRGSSSWRMKLAASAAYGLTEGSYNAQAVHIMDGGRSIVTPRNPEERIEALKDAARRPELLRRVYEHYDRGLPAEDDQFFFNVLKRDFDVPEKDVPRFVRILRANAPYAYPQYRRSRGAAGARN